jgi:hypothetical protein
MLFHHVPNSPPLLFLFLQQLQNPTRQPKHPPAKFPSSSFQVFQVKVASFFLSIRNNLPRIAWMITHHMVGSENDLAQSLTDGNTPPAHPKAALTQQKKKRCSHGGGVQGFRVWGRVHRFFLFCIFLLENLL